MRHSLSPGYFGRCIIAGAVKTRLRRVRQALDTYTLTVSEAELALIRSLVRHAIVNAQRRHQRQIHENTASDWQMLNHLRLLQIKLLVATAEGGGE